MHKTTNHTPWQRLARAVATGCVGAACAVTAVTAAAQDDAASRYEREVQACKSGTSAQSTETCLKEARNARDARAKGQLDTDDSALLRNRLQRCDAFEGRAKADCITRLSEHGQRSGSVAGGGILRSAETVVVPPDGNAVRIQPRTEAPVILVPRQP